MRRSRFLFALYSNPRLFVWNRRIPERPDYGIGTEWPISGVGLNRNRLFHVLSVYSIICTWYEAVSVRVMWQGKTTYILFEAASGYSLYEVIEKEEIAGLAKQVVSAVRG